MENGLENKLLKTYINSESLFLTFNNFLFFVLQLLLFEGHTAD